MSSWLMHMLNAGDTEQEITGDVLLELDVNLLKSEIGIMAFGKRMRIANAITDLRRPPSIEYSDHVASSDVTSVIHQQQSVSHSRTQSQFSHQSYPGSTLVSVVQGYSGIQTPSSQHFSGQGYVYGNPIPSVQETAPTPSEDVEQTIAAVAPTNGVVGLGISMDSSESVSCSINLVRFVIFIFELEGSTCFEHNK